MQESLVEIHGVLARCRTLSTGYLRKPYRMTDLLNLVGRLLNGE
jgi:hypothetical protein